MQIVSSLEWKKNQLDKQGRRIKIGQRGKNYSRAKISPPPLNEFFPTLGMITAAPLWPYIFPIFLFISLGWPNLQGGGEIILPKEAQPGELRLRLCWWDTYSYLHREMFDRHNIITRCNRGRKLDPTWVCSCWLDLSSIYHT